MKIRAYSYLALIACWAVSLSANADAQDWPYCRGPNFNGTSSVTGLIDNWNPRGGTNSNVAWKRSDLGGRSTPVVMDGRLYLLAAADLGSSVEGERVVCLNAKTGETLWEHKFNVFLSDVPDSRVGWSSVVCDSETGQVYALGVCGQFLCLNGDTGDVVWQQPLHEQFGLLSTYGGRTNFPVVVDNLVIVSAVTIGWGTTAKPAHRFLGLDKRSGEVIWVNGTRPLPYDTTYSAPSLANIAGQRLLVFGSGDGALWGLQPLTGKMVWRYPLSRRGLNAPPLVDGETVFIGHSEENTVGAKMGAVASLDVASRDGLIAQEQANWRVEEIMAGKSAPLKIGERLWVFDDSAKLHVLDAASGQRVARPISLGSSLRGNALAADGKVYVFSVGGPWSILAPDEKAGARVVSRGRLRGEEVLASPICAAGCIYLATTENLYCLHDASKQADTRAEGAGKATATDGETPVVARRNERPTQLQVVPAEVMLRPGQSTRFRVQLFNALGESLGTPSGESEVSFRVEGSGAITADGAYSPSESSRHEAATIIATVGELTAEARVRIVPPLPWSFDFEDIELTTDTPVGEPPITWVGARQRHVVRRTDDGNVMVKVTTVPKGTRSRSWMGPSTLSQYTVEADVRGAVNDGKQPDVGLIAQGYTLDLMGAEQKLEIRTWVTQRRMAKTVDFPWQADVWYRMKLQASLKNDRAILRGKVWPRGEPEPSAWTIEAQDESPNISGSPGLFGNATVAEVFYDNIRVTANDIAPADGAQ